MRRAAALILVLLCSATAAAQPGPFCTSPPVANCINSLSVNGAPSPANISVSLRKQALGRFTLALVNNSGSDWVTFSELSPTLTTSDGVTVVFTLLASEPDPKIAISTGLISSWSFDPATRQVTMTASPRSSSRMEALEDGGAGCNPLPLSCGPTADADLSVFLYLSVDALADALASPTLVAKASGLTLSTNAQYFSPFPEYDASTNAISFQVGSPHFKKDGATPTTGFVKLFVPDALWAQFTASVPFTITNTTVKIGGSAVAFTVTPTTGGVVFEATGFGYSVPTVAVAPLMADAPTITGITPGDTTLSVAFTAPTFTGGTSITNYEYSTDDGTTWTARSPAATTSPLKLTGLTNGTAYPVKLRAVNTAGSGAASTATNGTPANSAPTISDIADRTVPKNGSSGAVAFTVGDADTDPAALLLTGSSSNTTLIPNANIVFGGSGTNRTVTVTPALDQTGTATITVTVADGAADPRSDAPGPAVPLTASDTFVVTVPAVLTYYLSEGATGPFFDLELALANPNTVAAPVAIQYLKEDGSTVNQALTLVAQSRQTVLVDSLAGLDNTAVSTVVTSSDGLPLAVERTMTWDATGYGSHTEKATPGANLTWYFAEGSEQGFFDTYLLLANPQTAANRATVQFLIEGGSPVTKVYDLLPTSRTNVFAQNVEDPPGTKVLIEKAFGIVVTFDQPGVAERAMYFGASPFWNGGHESAGVNAPSTNWFHAEGATGSFFDTFILLSNPNATAATVTLRFLLDSGATVTRTKTVGANARLTVGVEGEDPLLANAAMATQVTSDVSIVSERAMYWAGYPNWYEAHNAFGVIATSTKWALGEGRVGGTSGYETYILLANPGTTAATVTVTYLREGGLATIVRTYDVPATSRFNVYANTVPGLASGERFGALIESTAPIAVERAMYSNASSQPGVVWAAGTNATGTPIP